MARKIPLPSIKYIKNENSRLFLPRIRVIIGILIFQVIVFFSYLKDTLAIAKSAVSNSDATLMMVRDAKTYSHTSVSYFSQIGLTISQSVALVFTYILLYKNTSKKKYRIAFIFGIVLYLVTSILTTNRSQLLGYASYVFVIDVIIYYKRNNWRTIGNFKIIIKAFLGVALALVAFYLAGLLTEKSLHYNNFFDNFANYFSSSIYALNKYILNPEEFTHNDFFGIYTFSGIYNSMRKAGIAIPKPIVALEYIKCGDYLTNIYTPLRRYYQDFGIVGDALIMFMLGFLYTRILLCNKREDSSGIIMIMSAYLYMPLFFMCVEERFFMNIVVTTTIQIVIFVYVIYRLLIGNPLRKRY